MAIPLIMASTRSGVLSPNGDASTSPSIILTKNSMPTARTSGSANGSSIRWRGSLVAIARPAATMVAVAPTLEARSQVSPSRRVESVLAISTTFESR